MAEAVSFYARSSRFNHAIRLAKDHGMDSEVTFVRLLLSARHRIMEARLSIDEVLRLFRRIPHRW